MADDIPKMGGGKDQDHSIEMTLLQALNELLTTQKAMVMPVEVLINSVTVKFDGTNYGLWLSMMGCWFLCTYVAQLPFAGQVHVC
jgi:hypothetical protein